MSKNHGLIGNGTAVGLIGSNGSLDWLCCPATDDPSHFSALIDDRAGGLFSIRPQGPFESSQSYLGNEGRSAVLETVFETPQGRGRLIDWMPWRSEPIVRRHVETLRGELQWELFCLPKFHYGQATAQPELTLHGICYRLPGHSDVARLDGTHSIRLEPMLGAGISRFLLASGSTAQFAWSWGRNLLRGEESIQSSFQDTLSDWDAWLHRCEEPPFSRTCPIKKDWHTIYLRSEVALKLLTHQGTGAFVESPTTSLPEVLGGTQNWDLRYCWVRHTPHLLKAWLDSNHLSEAKRLWGWIADRILSTNATELLPAYRLDGSEVPLEIEMHHFRGHQGSRPVRIGNQSARRFQLDTPASLLQSCALALSKFPIDQESPLWSKIHELIHLIAQVWKRPDHGIWDLRARPEHYLSSKIACWKGLTDAEQLLRTSGQSVPTKLQEEISKIRDTTLREGFNKNKQTYTQYFGGAELDSSALLVGLSGMQTWDQPEVVSTIYILQNELRSGPFLKKYQSIHRSEDFDGAHLLSTLWWIASLTEIGQLETASEALDELCRFTHPLGFLGEGVNPDTGNIVGNFPTSPSHAEFMSISRRLSSALSRAYPLAKTA